MVADSLIVICVQGNSDSAEDQNLAISVNFDNLTFFHIVIEMNILSYSPFCPIIASLHLVKLLSSADLDM